MNSNNIISNCIDAMNNQTVMIKMIQMPSSYGISISYGIAKINPMGSPQSVHFYDEVKYFLWFFVYLESSME